ncbi:MAG: 1-(5-phosphoribosyl)-5-[(5-phosphoribosylamino)methylideneamino]imidazole-4-carboxamide isomerase [Rickettsiales bacterium]|nr:1-(5-phosphoribosyl)-5-[(5-phosphoribosylamino)methylideneamino]imidazole-4-carboxamide isomerase [Rickettsiales bacterium]OUV76171.1 MAG: 1-(5-phosphoribosyl)-5-[(5-phosphoribosylamino)methylideneamino]imidazole-4-carboxamide isomerase [Rickettsiales bacterium TMED131]
MIVYPAIDLSDGEIVRLTKGDFNRKKIYKKNLIEQVALFYKYGANWIHLVDLDGALHGKNKNEFSIQNVLKNSKCKIQLGGGIRTLNNIDKWLNLGISRIILGTSAIKEENLVKDAVKAFPRKISVGLDLLGEYVAIKGWTEVIKEKKADYYFKKFSDLGVESIIYTDINNDGVLKGPNFENIIKYKNMIDVPLIASGGVSNIEDIKKLDSFNIDGVIVGKAIYDNKVDLKEILNIEK